ncbi:UDP-N-acetylmuramoyl-L-alanine--D-glutamate ligase [Solimonas sp. SE-A11]|uniref:UDP-N-acetylmuramoyl-L-alanine--D-glutamate ligase n=1 Tax=Solimonas sp. SE-A11 TaxID=3054954 RepID=UPI00259C9E1C|nr:UDP-N-acetylmuramoyl-L-alanine--D-glutamate ligase [Solimonas sp. SE-A11]MDM4770655.1 UDP-N-acetylmuramoyl-L-alanine--D-glutamate ligase [Solimonas sp. SE-A11]
MSRYAGKHMLVVGLGASGASALRYLVREGARVTATDSRAAPAGLAELQQQFPDIAFHCGAFAAPAPLSQYAEAVLSPGIALDEPFVRELAAAGVSLAGDVELFARAAKAPVIGITGSNGKSTVTTLVGEMALAAGLRTGIGGNLGTPALDLLRDDAQLYVLELSSFQLETTHSLRCVAATILNLSQDHLDRHGTMEHYGAIKARIFRGCATAVVNRDDAMVMALARESGIGNRESSQQLWSFGLGAPQQQGEYGLVRKDGSNQLTDYDSRFSIPDSQLKIHGLHNAANALAALALADAAGIPREASLRALRAFGGLAHRCQFVAEIDGVQYFNDSKGTNVGSTLAALNGLPEGIVWLAGGQGKGQSFTELREALAAKGRAAILFGEDAGRIEADVYGALPIYREPDMLAALARARGLAQRGDRVLLSPACASFDQFKSYVDRGNRFRAAVEAMR